MACQKKKSLMKGSLKKGCFLSVYRKYLKTHLCHFFYGRVVFSSSSGRQRSLHPRALFKRVSLYYSKRIQKNATFLRRKNYGLISLL